jgi:phospholipid N-methyltransferase
MTNNSTPIHKSLLIFAKALFTNPLKMGAAWPSSKRLAQAMVKDIPVNNHDSILELGAGTGVVTQALLEHGITPQQIFVLEHSKALANFLAQSYPNMHIIHGDALHIDELLSDKNVTTSAVVSSLPIKFFSQQQLEKLYQQIYQVLQPGGLYIQFTYDLRRKNQISTNKFKHLTTKYVWLNFPPAKVDVYRKM